MGEFFSFCLSALTTHQAASWKPVSGFPEGGSRAPVCGHPHLEGDWFSEPASGLPELPRALQGESPTWSPRGVGGGVEPELGVLRVPVDAAEKFPSVVLPEACEWTP